jgi:hypothetical protein
LEEGVEGTLWDCEKRKAFNTMASG